MSRLITIQQQNNGNCEACGREFENPIRLTNLSADPMQTYEACPFCFAKLNEILINEGQKELPDVAITKLKPTPKRKQEGDQENDDNIDCSHYLGYLKKRPKNAPIPDSCLTCQKMIKCIL